MSRVQDWLQALGLEQYGELFAHHRIGFDVLPELADADLEKLGIPLGDRKRLLRAAAGIEAGAQAAGDKADIPAGLERRPATVLFIDLTDYTHLTSELGAEFTLKLARRFHELAARAIADFGGSVERYIGDAVMGVFGIPTAHGNDPERALRAAMAIHGLMPVMSAQFGRELSVHIGAASGQVVASRRSASSGDFSTVGETVNLAARLVALAAAGETVVSESLHAATSELIDADPVGEVSVKGFDEPVRAWRLAGLRDRVASRRQLPMVGRRAELRQFEAACGACVDSGAGQVVYLRGDAGIGKSRLVEEMEAASLRMGFAVHKGLVLNFGVARAEDVIAQLAASLIGCEPAGPADHRAYALGKAVQDGLVLDDHLVFANDVLGIAQPPRLLAMYDAMDNATRARGRVEFVRALVQRCSEKSPLSLVVEDIHWADPVLLDIIAGLAALTATHPVLLLLTSRLEGDPLDRGWRARAGAAFGLLMMDLRPLRDSEVVDFARSLGASSGELIAQCAARAEGNPLFLEQLLRAAQMTERESVPGSIQSLVLSRLDRLPAHDQRAIRAASVLGQRFSLPVLRQLLDEVDYDCRALLEENLVRPMGEEFLFAHALIWESTYLSLVSDDKRRWHALAARWHANNDPALAAEHLDRAGDAQAARAYLTAAQLEKRQYRSDRALKLLDRGIELAVEQKTKFDLLAERGELLPDLGRTAEAIGIFEQALELATSDRERCRALIGIASGMRMADKSEAALATLAKAEPLASGPGAEVEAAQIHYLRGSLYFPIGNTAGCLREHEQALALARRAGSVEWEARALSGLGDAHYAACRPMTSYRYFEQCISLSRAHALGKVEVANLAMLSVFNVFFLTRVQEALELSRSTLDLAIKVGHRRAQVIALQGCANALTEMGEPSQGRPYAEESVELARSIGASRFVPEGMMFVATCLAHEGRTEEAAAMLREAHVLSREMITYFGPPVLGSLAEWTRDAGERERCLDEGQRILALGCPVHNHLFFYRSAIELSLGTGDWDAAARFADALEASFSEEPVPGVTFSVERARALVAAGRGGRDPALLATLEKLARDARDAHAIVSVGALDRAAARMKAQT
ncbi:MAG TPA: tetratricopeptide repeat protein [Burkholderiales bacterium]|nr:tetratricopeptide repeat protein [Burkholderiales bacterium]